MEKLLAQQIASKSTGKGKGKGKVRNANSEVVEQPPKRPRLEDQHDLRPLTLAIGELSLETSSKQRLQTGGLLRTCLTPVLDIFKEPLQVSESSNYSDPSLNSVLTWTSLVLALCKASLSTGASEAQTALQAYAAEQPDITALREAVHFCRVVTTYDSKQVKVQFWLSETLNRPALAVQHILVQLGGEIKYGPPPKSARERKVASLLAQTVR
ncbi:unnamed protein product [Polarella glacialis]|uniref:Uncharacterized protein n=1 Tax=Polarella glacialis TaxID=89957 RepID=A0A813HNP1_POLGL|nr:unnamed protein product [Polarella glacialis]